MTYQTNRKELNKKMWYLVGVAIIAGIVWAIDFWNWSHRLKVASKIRSGTFKNYLKCYDSVVFVPHWRAPHPKRFSGPILIGEDFVVLVPNPIPFSMTNGYNLFNRITARFSSSLLVNASPLPLVGLLAIVATMRCGDGEGRWGGWGGWYVFVLHKFV